MVKNLETLQQWSLALLDNTTWTDSWLQPHPQGRKNPHTWKAEIRNSEPVESFPLGHRKNETASKNNCPMDKPQCRHWKNGSKMLHISEFQREQPEGIPHIHKDTLSTLETRWYRHLHPEMFKLPNPCWLPQQVLWSWQADRYVCKQGHLKTDSKYCQTWHTTLHHVRQC